jgi:hypothetical protein
MLTLNFLGSTQPSYAVLKTLFNNQKFNLPPVFIMKANLMHYWSLIYFVKQPLHILGIFSAQNM